VVQPALLVPCQVQGAGAFGEDRHLLERPPPAGGAADQQLSGERLSRVQADGSV
jgi:hypothetical protein